MPYVGMINKEVIPKYLWKLFKMKVLFMIIRPYSESCIQSVKSFNVLLSGIVCFAPYVVKRSVTVTSNVYLFNLTIETLEKDVKYVQNNNKNTRTTSWRRSGVFIVTFEHISHLFLEFVFEQVNVSWVTPSSFSTLEGSYVMHKGENSIINTIQNLT